MPARSAHRSNTHLMPCSPPLLSSRAAFTLTATPCHSGKPLEPREPGSGMPKVSIRRGHRRCQGTRSPVSNSVYEEPITEPRCPKSYTRPEAPVEDSSRDRTRKDLCTGFGEKTVVPRRHPPIRAQHEKRRHVCTASKVLVSDSPFACFKGSPVSGPSSTPRGSGAPESRPLIEYPPAFLLG